MWGCRMQKLKTSIKHDTTSKKVDDEFDQLFGPDYNLWKLMGVSGKFSYP